MVNWFFDYWKFKVNCFGYNHRTGTSSTGKERRTSPFIFMLVMVGCVSGLICATIINAAAGNKCTRCNNKNQYGHQPFFHVVQSKPAFLLQTNQCLYLGCEGSNSTNCLLKLMGALDCIRMIQLR